MSIVEIFGLLGVIGTWVSIWLQVRSQRANRPQLPAPDEDGES